MEQVYIKKQKLDKEKGILYYLNDKKDIIVDTSLCFYDNFMISDFNYLVEEMTITSKRGNDYYINSFKYSNSYEMEEYRKEAYDTKEQTFLCIKHCGKYKNRYKSYQILLDEIKDNKYQIDGLPVEQYIKGRWNEKDENKYITNIMIPIKFNNKTMSIEELKKKYKQVICLKDGNYMLSTKDRKDVNEVLYEAHTNIDEVYGMEGNWGLVDKFGDVVIKPKYIYPFIECGDNYQVMQAYEYKMIDDKQKILTLKHGLIDKKGKILIPIKYLYMEDMDNIGMYFRVVDSKNYKSGVINKNNKVVVPFEYDFIEASSDLELRKKTEYCYDIYPDNIYQVKVSNNDLYGIYDLKLNREIIKPKYKYIKIIGYNKFLIGKDYDNCNTLINEKES